MSSFSFFVEKHDLGVLATMSGKADMGVADDLNKKLDTLLAGKPKMVVVDLSGMEYLNSLTISSLIRTQQALKAWGGQLRIANPSPYATSVFKSTRVGAVLPVFATVEAAWDVRSGAPPLWV